MKLIKILLISLISLAVIPAYAQQNAKGGGGKGGGGTDGPTLQEQIDALSAQITTLEATVASQETTIGTLEATVASQAAEISNSAAEIDINAERFGTGYLTVDCDAGDSLNDAIALNSDYRGLEITFTGVCVGPLETRDNLKLVGTGNAEIVSSEITIQGRGIVLENFTISNPEGSRITIANSQVVFNFMTIVGNQAESNLQGKLGFFISNSSSVKFNDSVIRGYVRPISVSYNSEFHALRSEMLGSDSPFGFQVYYNSTFTARDSFLSGAGFHVVNGYAIINNSEIAFNEAYSIGFYVVKNSVVRILRSRVSGIHVVLAQPDNNTVELSESSLGGNVLCVRSSFGDTALIDISAGVGSVFDEGSSLDPDCDTLL